VTRGLPPARANRTSECNTLDTGAGQWLRFLVGVLELAGAVGLLVPALVGAAAAGLAALLTGALIIRVAVLGGPPSWRSCS
jgi:uncharacterized membrane protein YphA (DoxX/SURF4 family)